MGDWAEFVIIHVYGTKVDLEATRERLRVDTEEETQQKIAVLDKLKDCGGEKHGDGGRTCRFGGSTFGRQ